MSGDFSRSLPPNPDLEQQKKQAKELLRAFQEEGQDATLRIRTQLPDKPDITLADAQFVIAREYGFDNWADLKKHIEAKPEQPPREVMQRALERRDVRTV